MAVTNMSDEGWWLTSDDPKAMYNWLTQPFDSRYAEGVSRRMAKVIEAEILGIPVLRQKNIIYPKVSHRKWKLFADACARLAYGDSINEEIMGKPPNGWSVRWAEMWVNLEHMPQSGTTAMTCANLLRDIIGNPWRQALTYNDLSSQGVLDWNDCLITYMAQLIYDNQDFGHLPMLADALEEAGCDNSDILKHCRGWDRPCLPCERHEPFPHPQECDSHGTLRPLHVQGCWALDIILGKE